MIMKKKFFDELAARFEEEAFENGGRDFSCLFDAIDKPAEISLVVKRLVYPYSIGQRRAHYYYGVDNLSIYDEECNNVADKYPRFCEKVKNCLPSYEVVIERIEEANMSYMELYFGSETNYINHRYGN